MSRAKILIMAGGTGGHVFPGLSVAKALTESGCSVIWLGTKEGIENKLVPEAGIDIEFISVMGLRGKNIRTTLIALRRMFAAFFQSFLILMRHRPQVVLGMGGFASGPGALAAFVLRYPLIIHEQNAVPGSTNRFLSKIASSVLEAFPGSFPSNIKAITIGNPVRREIAEIEEPNKRLEDREGPIRILVIGGSQGSLILNKAIPIALKELSLITKLEVLHQAGHKTISQAKEAYENVSVGLYLVEFIEDMADAYKWADMVICRAGAMTVTELTNVGLPAIFIPFSMAIDDHQNANAKLMQEVGAAEIIQEKDIASGALALVLRDWIEDRNILKRRANLATSLAKPESTSDIVEVCLNYVNQND